MFLRVGACIPGPALAALGKVPAPYHLPSGQVGTDLRERACCLVGGDGWLLAGSRWTLTPGQSPRVPRVLQCPGPRLCVGVAGTQEQGRLSTARQHPRVLGDPDARQQVQQSRAVPTLLPYPPPQAHGDRAGVLGCWAATEGPPSLVSPTQVGHACLLPMDFCLRIVPRGRPSIGPLGLPGTVGVITAIPWRSYTDCEWDGGTGETLP